MIGHCELCQRLVDGTYGAHVLERHVEEQLAVFQDPETGVWSISTPPVEIDST